MEGLRFIISLILGIALGALIANLLSDVVPENGIAQLFLAILVFGGSFCLVFVLLESLFEKGKEVKQNLTDSIQQKKLDIKLDNDIKNSIKKYNDAKITFQYFSDAKLDTIYTNITSQPISNMEQLALEEEMVKRSLLDHSPLHEKMYEINKNIFG